MASDGKKAERMSSTEFISGMAKHLEKLAILGDVGTVQIPRVIAETTLQSLELVTKELQNVRPHSGLHRQANPQPTVTDLVDTGFLINSFQVDVSQPNIGILATNVEYAPDLEYGRGRVRPYNYFRKTALGTRLKLKENSQNALLRAIKGKA